MLGIQAESGPPPMDDLHARIAIENAGENKPGDGFRSAEAPAASLAKREADRDRPDWARWDRGIETCLLDQEREMKPDRDSDSSGELSRKAPKHHRTPAGSRAPS